MEGMHSTAYVAAMVWLAGLIGAAIVLTARSRSQINQILVLDFLSILAICLLAVHSYGQGNHHYLDAALLLALLSFLGTLAAVRYLIRGKLF